MSDTQPVNDPTATTPVNLDVNDIANAVKIIDFACDQGAFKGWDTLLGVKGVRDRLSTFLASIPQPMPADPAAETAAPALANADYHI
jgi:hypothetical protein